MKKRSKPNASCHTHGVAQANPMICAKVLFLVPAAGIDRRLFLFQDKGGT